MVCQKSRDRQQQGMQKQQRSLPPKKRTIHEIAPTSAPTPFTSSSGTNTSPISGTDAPVTATKIYQPNPPAPVSVSVSADDQSVGNSSTASYASSFSNTVTFNSNNKFSSSVKTKPQVPVATVTTQTIANSSTTGMGGRGILPFISNDSQFVASILRQREALEVFRASKAMLYDAYMKALNEQ
jgi:transcription initiation factor TFIID subunit TAF12